MMMCEGADSTADSLSLISHDVSLCKAWSACVHRLLSLHHCMHTLDLISVYLYVCVY